MERRRSPRRENNARTQIGDLEPPGPARARRREARVPVLQWDMLFGIYENPAAFDSTCGVDSDKEERPGVILLYRDVHREP
jgi:hypothetical protein